jgi:Family of unknown function (DUF5419)
MTWIDDNRERIGAAKIVAAMDAIIEKDPRYLEECAHGDPGFAIWLKLVDRSLGVVSHRDIADWSWRDAYNDGVEPSEAAKEALAADGFVV